MATSWNTADLWERHEQAIKVLQEGCQPDLRATRQGRERLLRRHEIALEFELAAADESRRSIEVDLSSLKASPASERRLARVAATGIPLLSVLRDSRTPPRFTDGGRKRLMQLLDVLGLSRQALGLISEAIETYLERWPEHSNQQGYLIARIVMQMAERRTLTIPVDIVPVSASEQIEIATYARREDWLSATGALPKGDSPLSIYLTLPVATFSRWTARQKPGAQSSPTTSQWVMTPNATWSAALLRYLQEVLSLGYPVTCSLRRSTRRSTLEANTPADVLIATRSRCPFIVSYRDSGGGVTGSTLNRTCPWISRDFEEKRRPTVAASLVSTSPTRSSF